MVLMSHSRHDYWPSKTALLAIYGKINLLVETQISFASCSVLCDTIWPPELATILTTHHQVSGRIYYCWSSLRPFGSSEFRLKMMDICEHMSVSGQERCRMCFGPVSNHLHHNMKEKSYPDETCVMSFEALKIVGNVLWVLHMLNKIPPHH
jgi:hypothetical protein